MLVLDNKISEKSGLRFSAHALKRLENRNIHLGENEMSRLQNGIDKIEKKGGKSSVILLDDMAYIVSVRNKTIVTALGKEATKANVFTNVDSVAIV